MACHDVRACSQRRHPVLLDALWYIDDCKCTAFPPLVVGAGAQGASMLGFFAKLADLRWHTIFANTPEDKVAALRGHFCNPVYGQNQMYFISLLL